MYPLSARLEARSAAWYPLSVATQKLSINLKSIVYVLVPPVPFVSSIDRLNLRLLHSSKTHHTFTDKYLSGEQLIG